MVGTRNPGKGQNMKIDDKWMAFPWFLRKTNQSETVIEHVSRSNISG
jgi:hypothetical protein